MSWLWHLEAGLAWTPCLASAIGTMPYEYRFTADMHALQDRTSRLLQLTVSLCASERRTGKIPSAYRRAIIVRCRLIASATGTESYVSPTKLAVHPAASLVGASMPKTPKSYQSYVS